MNLAAIPNPDLNDIAARARDKGLSFRSITGEDMAFLRDVYASTRTQELARTPWSDEEKTTFIDMQFNAQHVHYLKYYPDAVWLIIEQAGRAIGRLYLERWKTEHRIIDIALLPASRGQGTGAAILRDLQDDAAQVGKMLSIHVEKNNPARRLYDRLGFQTVEEKDVYDLMTWQSGN